MNQAGVQQNKDLTIGAFFMVSAAFLFAAVSVGVKLSSRTMPDEMIVFFRNAGALAALLPFLPAAGGLGTRRLPAHLVRSLAGLASMICTFYALARMPLGDAMLLSYTSPLFMPWLSAVWVREPAPAGIGPALALGFLGVALVMKPGAGLFTVAAVTALASGFLGAVAQVGIRDLTRTEPVLRILFYFSAVSTAVSAVPLLWAWRTPSGMEWAVLVGTGVVASAAQSLLTRAYRCAPPAQVGPFIYGAVVFSAGWDWLLWRHRPGALSFLGAALIVAAGAFILRRSPRSASLPPLPR
jgi:drug/metabolite transporter (DMT)-like permease